MVHNITILTRWGGILSPLGAAGSSSNLGVLLLYSFYFKMNFWIVGAFMSGETPVNF